MENKDTQPQEPTLQIALRSGTFPGNDDTNVWRDYFKLIVVHARMVAPTGDQQTTTATTYLMFGAKNGTAFLKPVTKEEAERAMVDAFMHGITAVSYPTNSAPQTPPPEVIFGDNVGLAAAVANLPIDAPICEHCSQIRAFHQEGSLRCPVSCGPVGCSANNWRDTVWNELF